MSSTSVPFAVDRPFSFFIGSDEALRAEIETTAREFLDKTTDYWRDWVRSLSIPFDWQDEVIRAAITLKLCTFEETGAIVAALTTSIPEAPGTQRNWDYRFCWLRDAYFVVHALNRLGTTRTMEEYLSFITNIVDSFYGKRRRASAAALSDHARRHARRVRGAQRSPAIAATSRCASATARRRRSRTTAMARSCWRRRIPSSTSA